ncbi:hypothetical protein PMI14_01216 [Acidovorax sp. CF316]|uniref:bluetail domain-containing putative surface protein n=1 Tax=Acidovorax sp. CF316 TaxID=1144317 RepID=UPI00026BDAC1|nr:bluetail domain-containing putative surface protein [Acidovorax sp. CF316]EJE53893.1 hypothetical protein PMI14_01216 [Acidovorax sp. CF316]
MPVQVFGADATFAILNRVFYGQQPLWYESYIYTVAKIGSEGAHAVAREFGEGYARTSEAYLSYMLLETLGLLPNPALRGALEDYLAAVGKANVGVVALQLGQILSGLEGATGDLAIYSAAAARWNDEIAAVHAYSSNPSNKGYATVDVISEGPGVTLELTTGNDTLQGTRHDDVFLAQSPGQLGSADVIEGGGHGMKDNVLKATLAAGDQVVPTLSNIESVFITAGAEAQLGAEKSGGIWKLWLDAATGSNVTFTGVNRETGVGIQNSLAGTALTVHFKAPSFKVAPVNLMLADATGADEIIVPDVIALNIASTPGSVAATTVNSARITAAAAEEIRLTGNQALTTTITGAHVQVINAAALQAPLDLTFATTGATPIGILGGQAADRITVNDTSGGRAAIDAGAGADTVTIGARNAHSITLGAGADVLALTGLAGPASAALGLDNAAALRRSAIEVTDFVSGTDQLRLTAATPTAKAAPSSAQLASIAASTSLLDAAALAASTAGASKAIAFGYGGDTYILVNDATAALGSQDGLVRLSGVSAVADGDWTVG